MPAIGAVRRKALRRKSIFKKVRIGVGANPALVTDLEISLGNVGEQRGKRSARKSRCELGVNKKRDRMKQ